MSNKQSITKSFAIIVLVLGLLVGALLTASTVQTINVVGQIAENQAVEIGSQILDSQFPDERVEAWRAGLIERVQEWLPYDLSSEE
ncbi:MAG: hypothetical protein AAF633_01360 [Chloroflexota bacterium]